LGAWRRERPDRQEAVSDPNPTNPSVDPETLPKHLDAVEIERRWHAFWERSGVYHWRDDRPRDRTFVVDTPPPTVSGSLHVGHVFSFTQTDVAVRYKRMRGFDVYYPMGWDDNGLPTERRVQNYFHVRCDPALPPQAGLTIDAATDAERKTPARRISRENFVELCQRLTAVDERAFLEIWQRLGLSIDWRQTYSTIDRHCRTIAQRSFLDLNARGHIYQNDAPTMWDVDFQTAVAQAETEERKVQGAYHRIEFGVDGGDGFVIATTRPELLPACVGVAAHPEDVRYQHLFGQTALTPLFRTPVPIFASGEVDPGKGTGILMVCTFGDQHDVAWWRERRLPLRQVLGRDGRLRGLAFGSDEFPSRDPAAANAYYAQLAGKDVKRAQLAIVELLRDPAGSATGSGPALRAEPERIEHMVKFFEKGDRPLELISSRQWFVRLVDKIEALLAKGSAIGWHPDFMRVRYIDWTRNLNSDWCVSRQRYFGVAIPVWYPLDDQAQPRFDAPLWPDAARVPIDPMSDAPSGYAEHQRGQPLGFAADLDVFDTWFTSSMTPQINSHWQLDSARHAKLFPTDIRPQGHEIIRTWAFYTIAKAMLHQDAIPWKHILLSGWVLDPDRKKMSKSKGNVVTPTHLLEKYSADAVRYWAASARLGVDTAFDEKVLKTGKRLTTKLFNAGKFVLGQRAEALPITFELDRAFIAQLRALVSSVTTAHEDFESARALAETETFFWSSFTDAYLELGKARARGGEGIDAAAQGSAVTALRLAFSVLVRLFAPFVPYITEELWSWGFGRPSGADSVHLAAWPSDGEFAAIAPPRHETSFALAIACQNAINRAKANLFASSGRPIRRLTLLGSPASFAELGEAIDDVMAATRCASYVRRETDPIPEHFQVVDLELELANPG
jgi:valyl-tRNA synthetase